MDKKFHEKIKRSPSPPPRDAPVVQVAVGVVVHRHEHGLAVLIARRPSKNVLGGYWEFPGGKREAGETLPECLKRELTEELGIEVDVTEPLPVVSHQYDHAHVQLHPFFCRWISGHIQRLAVAEAKWVAPHTLVDFQFPPANTDLVRTVVDRLSNHPMGHTDGV